MRGMILAAGYGTRLGGLTAQTPKPMLDVAGRPLLSRIAANAAAGGFDELVINLHFRPERIREALGEGRDLGATLSYIEEPQLLGTAGGLRHAAWFFEGAERFLVHYGDVLSDEDLGEIAAAHRPSEAAATLLVHQRRGSNSILRIDADGRVGKFLERPTQAQRQAELGDEADAAEAPWVFSGVAICSQELLAAIPAEGACDLPRDVFPALAEAGRLRARPLSGRRWAIDSPERLEQAREAVAAGLYRGR